MAIALFQRHYRPDGSPVIQFSLELDVVDSTQREVNGRPDREQVRGDRRHSPNRTGSRSLIDVVAIGEWAEFETRPSAGRPTPSGRGSTQPATLANTGREKTDAHGSDCHRPPKGGGNKPAVCLACNKNDNMGSIERGEKNEETF